MPWPSRPHWLLGWSVSNLSNPDRPQEPWPRSPHLTVAALPVAEDVTSPVSFAKLRPESSGTSEGEPELEAGRAYRVLVCLADGGRMAGTPIPFRVK